MEGPAASGSVAEDSSAGSYVSISPRFAEMTSQRNSYSYEEAFSDEIGWIKGFDSLSSSVGVALNVPCVGVTVNILCVGVASNEPCGRALNELCVGVRWEGLKRVMWAELKWAGYGMNKPCGQA